MIDPKDIAVALTYAHPPAPVDEAAPTEARSLRGAIRNIEREAELMKREATSCRPFHETLQELARRL